MNPNPLISLGVSSDLEETTEDLFAPTPNWQFDQMIGANPVASVNLVLMIGVVVGWFIKRQ